MSNAIDFIAADAARAQGRGRRALLSGLGVAVVAAVLGLITRKNLAGLESLGEVAGPALGCFLLAVMGATWDRSRRQAALFYAMGLGLLATSLAHGGGELPGEVFAGATSACFAMGLVAAGAVAFALAAVSARVFPAPSRAAQIAAAVLAGATGVALQSIHCPAGDWRHIMLGHWLPQVPVFFFGYFLQRRLFRRSMQVALGEPAGLERLEDLNR